jgi:hypothetical protein
MDGPSAGEDVSSLAKAAEKASWASWLICDVSLELGPEDAGAEGVVD